MSLATLLTTINAHFNRSIQINEDGGDEGIPFNEALIRISEAERKYEQGNAQFERPYIDVDSRGVVYMYNVPKLV